MLINAEEDESKKKKKENNEHFENSSVSQPKIWCRIKIILEINFRLDVIRSEPI